MDDKVKEETVWNAPPYTGKLYGVELEIEAAGLYSVEEFFDEESESYQSNDPDVPKGWLYEQEDSIEGPELISDQPYDLETSIANIRRVYADIEKKGYEPIRTPRGSTHVHANVSDLTWKQMKSFVMACIWAEPLLIELAGPGRKGNLFAQSYATTPIGWTPVINWCREERLRGVSDTHYMGTSFHSVLHQGSVEFRMGPSMRNSDEAVHWLELIDVVVDAGRTQEIGLEMPSFVMDMAYAFPANQRFRLLKKCQAGAEAVYYDLIEPYVKPEKTPKSLGLGIDSVQVEPVMPSPHAPSPYPPISIDYEAFLNHIPSPVPSPTLSNHQMIDTWLNNDEF